MPNQSDQRRSLSFQPKTTDLNRDYSSVQVSSTFSHVETERRKEEVICRKSRHAFAMANAVIVKVPDWIDLLVVDILI